MAQNTVTIIDRAPKLTVATSGPQGVPGVGVPAGGSANQILAKIDATDYNTQWITNTGGTGATTLDALTDTTIDLVDAGEVIVWDAVSSAWINQTLAEAGIAALSHTHTLSQISDAGTAAAKNIPAAGDASTAEVVFGTDTRLSDDRNPTTHSHAFTEITGTLANAQVVAGNVTQHQAALSITESQIIDLQPYLTTVSLDGVSDVTITAVGVGDILKWSGTAWVNNTLANAGISAVGHAHSFTEITGTLANAQVVVGNVTQHQAALSITESQIGDLQPYLTDLSSQTTTNLAEGTNLYYTDERVDDRVAALLVSGTNVTLTYNDVANTLTIASSGATTLDALTDTTITSVGTGDVLKWDGTAWINNTLANAGISAVGHAHAAADTTSGVFDRNRCPDMIGASSFSAGSEGQVPIPQIADRTLFLKGNGAWDAPTDTHKLAEVRATADGGGSEIVAVIIKGYVEEAATINAASIVADVSGSIVVTVKRDRGGTISTLGPITLASAASVRDTTLTGWTTDLAVGDIVIFEFGTGTTVTRATATLGRTVA